MWSANLERCRIEFERCRMSSYGPNQESNPRKVGKDGMTPDHKLLACDDASKVTKTEMVNETFADNIYC